MIAHLNIVIAAPPVGRSLHCSVIRVQVLMHILLYLISLFHQIVHTLHFVVMQTVHGNVKWQMWCETIHTLKCRAISASVYS